MAFGVFDLLHLGHVHYLEEAKRLGDELVVVVARDSVTLKRKHKTVTPEDMRRRLVAALKSVDRAVLGYEEDPFRIVEELRPEIIALGYDDPLQLDEAKRELERRGLRVRVVRLSKLNHDLDGTRKIIERIRS